MADDGGDVVGQALGIVCAILGPLGFVAWIVSRGVYIVHQAEGIIIERFGFFNRILPSGINFTVPFMDVPRRFSWARTYVSTRQRGALVSEATNEYRMDTRESVFNFTRCRVYTKDTIELDVNTIMYYRINDIRKAVYEVEDLNLAISNFAQTQLKEVFGDMTFAESIRSQQKINRYMQDGFGPRFHKWGVKVERMELLEVTPRSGIAEAMKKQMVAERVRRGEFIEAEGRKAAMRIKSEGTKIRALNLGIAEQDATRKTSEGVAGAKIEMARAERQALDLVASTLVADGAQQTEYMVAQKYMQLCRTIPTAAARQTIYLPYQQGSLTGLIGGLSSVYGFNAVPPVPKPLPARGGRSESKVADGPGTGAEFDDLS